MTIKKKLLGADVREETSVRLFGQRMTSLRIDLEKATDEIDAGVGVGYGATSSHCLARIYAVAIAGAFFELEPPRIFLVCGEGVSMSDSPPPNIDQVGVAFRGDLEFVDGITVWSADAEDLTLCCDLSIGTVDELVGDSIAEGTDDGSGGRRAVTQSQSQSKPRSQPGAKSRHRHPSDAMSR